MMKASMVDDERPFAIAGNVEPIRSADHDGLWWVGQTVCVFNAAYVF